MPNDVLDVVQAYLSDEIRRPIADRLTVQSVKIVPFTIDARIFLPVTPESELILSAAKQSLQNYLSSQRHIGQSIRLSALYASLHVEGVQRVVLNEPQTDKLISNEQVAFCDQLSIRIGANNAQ